MPVASTDNYNIYTCESDGVLYDDNKLTFLPENIECSSVDVYPIIEEPAAGYSSEHYETTEKAVAGESSNTTEAEKAIVNTTLAGESFSTETEDKESFSTETEDNPSTTLTSKPTTKTTHTDKYQRGKLSFNRLLSDVFHMLFVNLYTSNLFAKLMTSTTIDFLQA